MGTPGDKAEIGKVVKGDPDQQPPPQEQSPPLQATSEQEYQPLEQASTSSSSVTTIAATPPPEMGVLSRLPQFETFATISSKPESFQQLEQATIEDYYTQTKYYPSVTESLVYYPSTSQPQQQQQQEQEEKAFPLDQPGPSGLQQRPKVKRKKPQTAKKTHTCQHCQKSFASVEKLTKHQQTHATSGGSPFKCEHCKKSFSSKFKLVRHALIHSDRKPFSCTVCERTFHRKDHLKNHIKVHSPSKKVYSCEKIGCKKEYTSLMSYRKHLALHAAEEGSLECQICSNTFETKEQILYHLKIHAGSRTVKNPNEKKFTCESCDRKFFTKKDVRRHLVVHTGMRDFLCQFCPQRFGRKDHLVRHIKKSHSKNYPQSIETAIKTEPIQDQPVVDFPAFQCQFCTQVFDSDESLLRHNETHIAAIKMETKPETVVKPEQQEEFVDFSLDDVSTILEEESFEEILSVLPSTSSQVELKDLGGEILEGIEETETQCESGGGGSEGLLDKNVVLSDPEIQRLLQPSEEKNLPLPGFSQTFQSPPPP